MGGGHVGLELATLFMALGSKVSLLEKSPALLREVDKDLKRVVEPRLKKSLDNLWLDSEVRSVKEEKDEISITFRHGKKRLTRSFDTILVTIGRTCNTDGINLRGIGIDIDGHGSIRVNSQRKTSLSHIFAVGDITGPPHLAHKAAYEGKLAVDVISGRERYFEPWAIPMVVYTDPEIAWCGITEKEAKRQKFNIKTSCIPWRYSAKALMQNCPEGLTKLIVEKGAKQILGMGVVGPGAAEMITEGVLAVEMEATVEDLQFSIHPHPTLSETAMEAAESVFGSSTHAFDD
ncbi:MAG: FAD-dependent oxidoreductase [Magnetococcales bacterium]|nr:FAD-dependent oxidoreductase [Magnetococcales bacterium]